LLSKKEEFSVRKLLDGAPKPHNYEKLYCPNKRYLTPTPGQPLWENCSFTAPKTLGGYEAYKEHWFKEHANEQEMAVRKVKSQVGDAYYISIDLMEALHFDRARGFWSRCSLNIRFFFYLKQFIKLFINWK
jgi:hypothetical protein